MLLQSDDVEIIVVALLAVNRYSLEMAYNILPNLQDEGLLAPKHVVSMSIEDIISKLYKSGYRRGGLMELMAIRYLELNKAIDSGKLDSLIDYIADRKIDKASACLQKVKGIGPSVANTIIEILKSKYK